MQNSEPSVPAASDRETFRRVWQRVMPEERPDCPITLTEPVPPPEPPVPPPEEPLPESALLLEESPVPLGRSSAVHIPLLQEMILRELADRQFYLQLSRRAGGQFARALSAAAKDEQRHAKRLSAAAFLISGVRYLPSRRSFSPPPATLANALRSVFSAEQCSEAAYRAAAEETEDEALRTLWLELAEEEAAHGRLVRTLLEQL